MSTEFVPENQVMADLAETAAGRDPVMLETGRDLLDGEDLAVFVLTGEQHTETIDLERYAQRPARKKGHVTTADHASLVAYVARHKEPSGTTLWGDRARGKVIAVLDDHEDIVDRPQWGEHRASLILQPTPEWTHWLTWDGKMRSQSDFAQHLEDGADSVVEPSAADLLDVALGFQAKNNVTFRSVTRLDNGEVQLTYEETIQAKAGQKGQMSIPASFSLGLAPYEGTDPYRMLARFRYRLHDGQLTLGYRLVRPDQVQRAAFTDITTAITTALELPVMLGTPR